MLHIYVINLKGLLKAAIYYQIKQGKGSARVASVARGGLRFVKRIRFYAVQMSICISPVYGSINTVHNTAVKSEPTILIQKKIKNKRYNDN